MISCEHIIYKIAFAAGETNDWLPYAEELVRKWSTQKSDEVKLYGFDLTLASLLLEDDLLPDPARIAYARLMHEIMKEAAENKLTLKCLGIGPSRSGRKKTDPAETGYRLHKVHKLITHEGITATDAYNFVAKECFKSPDTIRREYERVMKKRPKKEAEN